VAEPRALVVVIAGLGLVPLLGAQDTSVTRAAHVTYVTAASVYIDAGRADGLRDSARVDVVRNGQTVAVLKVGFLSSHQSSCEIVSATVPLAEGDVVRYRPQAAAVARDSTPQAAVAHRATPSSAPAPSFTVRGRVGVHYLDIVEHDGGGALTQPGLDIRLVGGGAGPLAVVVDVRARNAAAQEPPTRVFQAAVTWNAPGSPYRFALGRQYAPGLYSAGLVDGLSAERIGRGFDVGLFTGMQPELGTLAYSSDMAQGGIYIRGHNHLGSNTSWYLTAGASGSYQQAVDGWKANREFFVLEGNFNSRRASGFISQEIDYYRPWKQEQVSGLSTISPTSTYANVRWSATEGGGFTVYVGFDNRRDVLLYQEIVNPETAFDATFRQGEWGGASLRLGRHVLVAGDARLSAGGSSGATRSYSFSFTADRLAGVGLGFRSRSTWYHNLEQDGWLESLALGFQPGGSGWGSRVHFEATGGWRNEQDAGIFVPSTHLTWIGAEVDLNVARQWFLTFSGNRQRGPFENSDLWYGGFSVRF